MDVVEYLEYFFSEIDIIMHPLGSMNLVFYAHVAPFTNID